MLYDNKYDQCDKNEDKHLQGVLNKPLCKVCPRELLDAFVFIQTVPNISR